MTCESASMSSLLTWSSLGSAGGSARSSLADTLLFRFVNGLTKVVSCAGDDSFAVGIKTRLCGLCPVLSELDEISLGIVGSKEDTMGRRFSSVDLKAVEVVALEVVGDSVDVFEFTFDIHWVGSRVVEDPNRSTTCCQFFHRHRHYQKKLKSHGSVRRGCVTHR